MSSEETPSNLFGLGREELESLVEEFGQPAFRARQLFRWLYHKRVESLDQMTNLPKTLRQQVESRYRLDWPRVDRQYVSNDGSIKYVFKLFDGREIEAVYMQMTKGVTLCLSSQVGCAQDCSFCLTAEMGFIRNLSAGEIVGQVAAIAKDRHMDPPFNIVMMGMGEPLLNLRNLIGALSILSDPEGFGISLKRMTVSTSGHVRNLIKLAQSAVVPRLAISLNASTDEQRNRLMPVNLKWNIAELMDACRTLPIKARERLTFEYVLIADINDSDADARRLVQLVKGIRCKVNLIPFNETPSLAYRQPPEDRILQFQGLLNRAGVTNTVRWSKGRDIGAACGQLARPVGKRGAHILAV